METQTDSTESVVDRAVAAATALAAQQEAQGREQPVEKIRLAMRAAAIVPAMADERCATLGQQLIGEPMTREQVHAAEAALAD